MLPDNVKITVKEQFKLLQNNIKLIFFTQELECLFCKETRELVEELAEISDKIKLEIYNFQTDKEKTEFYKIDKIPAIAVIGDKDYNIRFYGIPAGYEFTSLIETIKFVSNKETNLSIDTKKFLDGLQKDIHLQVFVTPTCPYCPQAVILAHKFAFYSDKVRSDMIESNEFQHLAIKYNVMGVPRTVINDKFYQEGAAPERMLIEKIKEALN